MRPFQNPAVKYVFESYPAPMRAKLLILRELIFSTAASTAGVGDLEETLKWGEPAYATTKSKSGSPVRIAYKAARPTQYAMYFICHTNLVETFKTMFPNDFKFEGNRAIVFEASDRVPTQELAWCITAALTYHSNKNIKKSN
jgi:Domain of unknown function (DU1801)